MKIKKEALSKKSLKKIAGPDAFGGGVSPMGGGGGASGGQVNPAHVSGPSSGTPEGMGAWSCKYPGCHRNFNHGGDLREHLWKDHDVRDIG